MEPGFYNALIFYELLSLFIDLMVGAATLDASQLVTAEGCRNLTNCPRKSWEIEAVMAGAPWPPAPAALGQNGGCC